MFIKMAITRTSWSTNMISDTVVKAIAAAVLSGTKAFPLFLFSSFPMGAAK